jgi:hypothetical protein
MVTKAPQKPGQQQQVRPRSFLVGTQAVIEGGDYDVTLSAIVNATAFTPWTLQATGWLRGLLLLCQISSVTGTVATVADGPFIAFSNVELDDVNNEAIFGPFDGYTAFLTNKYGGYFFWDDPATQSIYYYATSANGSGFFAQWALYIPLEIVARDPLGPVASVNNTASLTLKLTANSVTNVFGASATAYTFRVRGIQLFYWEPKKQDKQGRPISPEPPGSGTTQYWTQGSIAVAGAGTINSQLITGLGYPFRNYAFLLRDTNGTRATGETDWPDPLIGLKFEANMLISQLPKLVWQQMMSKEYGHPATTMDVRGTGAAGVLPGKENGVYMVNWNKDFAWSKPGSETRKSYLITSPGSNYIYNGAVGNAATLYSVVNYISPGGGAGNKQNTATLTGGQ